MSLEINNQDFLPEDSAVEILTNKIRREMFSAENPAKRKLKLQYFKYYKGQIGIQE